jgi:hypothetical protein
MKKGLVENMKNIAHEEVGAYLAKAHDKYCTLDDCKLGLPGTENASLEATAKKYFTAVEEEARLSPLIQRFAREFCRQTYKKRIRSGVPCQDHHGRGGHGCNNYIVAPWQAQAERLLATWSITQPQTILSPDLMHPHGPKSDILIRMSLVHQMQESQVYLLRKEIIKLLTKMPIPPHIIGPDLMPYPTMYITTEYSLKIATSLEEEKSPLDCDWMLLQTTPEGVNVILPATVPGEKHSNSENWNPAINGYSIGFNKVWPDDFKNPDQCRFILGVLAFLNSPFVASEPTKLPRSVRREFKRVGQNDPDLLTNVVTLRRSAHNGNNSGNAEPLTHDNQWWVSGHIRAQWYPSVKAHKLIWIAPHLKGPEGKPVKEKTYMAIR